MEKIKLFNQYGKLVEVNLDNVVLFFYSTNKNINYINVIKEFQKYKIKFYAITPETPDSNFLTSRFNSIEIDILTDYDLDVSKKFGVFIENSVKPYILVFKDEKLLRKEPINDFDYISILAENISKIYE
jgi:peroxiredoxin